MTTHQMQAFLTLANTLNYTKASQLLHTTQPNLSKIVMNLEQETGVHLLERNKRDVKLTPAGEAFYAEIGQVMQRYEAALEKTRQVYEGITGVLEVGFLGTALTGVLPGIVSRFRAMHPKILLNLRDYTYSPLASALIQGEVDVAMLPDRQLSGLTGIDLKFLYADDMCLVVNKNHRLANAEAVELAELEGEPFVMMAPDVSSWDVELVNAICADAAFAPKVVHQANTLNNLMLMIGCDVGVSILARHMQRYAPDEVRFVRIRGYESYFRVACAWRREANANIRAFIDVLAEHNP